MWHLLFCGTMNMGWPAMKRALHCVLATVAMLGLYMDPFQRADSLITLTLTAVINPVIQLSTGVPQITASQCGASVGGGNGGPGNSLTTVDFGDLALGDGTPVVARIPLQIRSNCKYRVCMSRSEFTTVNFQYDGRPVDGPEDAGFVRIAAESAQAQGSLANPGATTVSARLGGEGIALSELTAGGVTADSTEVASGSAACLGGGLANPDNAVVVHLNVSCPTGMVLGPRDGVLAGSFHATMQIGIFPCR
jgi:hypothetical protein